MAVKGVGCGIGIGIGRGQDIPAGIKGRRPDIAPLVCGLYLVVGTVVNITLRETGSIGGLGEFAAGIGVNVGMTVRVCDGGCR